MTRDEIRAQVLAAVVPELDIDPMDFLNFTIGLHKAFGVEIPEQDYRKLATLDACVDYVAAALPGAR